MSAGGREAYPGVRVGGEDYKDCPASATTVLGATGAKGDFLSRLVVKVSATLTAPVSIKDGGNPAIVICPIGTPIGVYPIELGARSTQAGGWSVITGDANATVLGIGKFTD